MLTVLPFCVGDAPQALDLLKWIEQIGGCCNHHLLLACDSNVDWHPANECVLAARKSFDQVELIVLDPPVIGWPAGANALWLLAAQHVSKNHLGPWLWLEPDAVPLRPNWLALIEAEHLCEKGQFRGHIYDSNDDRMPGKVMSGIAVYPERAWDYRDCVKTRAFDVALSEHIMPYAAHTDLIFHIWGENNLPPTFVKQKTAQSPRHAFALQQINPKAVIFHRNKDGTLIRLLREQRGIPVEAPDADKLRWQQDRATAPASPKVRQGGGGGEPGTEHRPIIVRRTGALGDALAATCVAKALKELGHKVIFQSHPNCHCILKRVPYLDGVEEPRRTPDIDLDGAYERNPHRKVMHFAQMFTEHANHGPIKLPPARNFAPRMTLEPHELVEHYRMLEQWPKPWTMICPRSDSHANRTIPDHIWAATADKIVGTKFWLGRHPAPANIVDLQIRHFDNTIKYLGLADLLVTVDTGPAHVAAALGTPFVVVEQQSDPALHFSDQVDFVVVRATGTEGHGHPLPCLNCQDTICRIHATEPPCQKISPDLIAQAANKKLEIVTTDGVSAIVCIWKPQVEKLNRCLAAVLPQVQEVIVSVDASGYVPNGMMTDPKIRLVKHRLGNIGYGRNANAGVRHSNNRWLWLINDDLYPDPNVCEHLKSLMTVGVGVVGHLLRYPGGTVQHGGTYRNPGDYGFGHVDHLAPDTRYKEPLEMENVTGASMLVRRDVFYQIGGFDEEYGLYAEDTDFCMKVRQSGWKIMFTPLVCGIHEEHQSSSLKPDIHDIMARSHAIFGRKWGWYFEKNKWTVPGTFD